MLEVSSSWFKMLNKVLVDLGGHKVAWLIASTATGGVEMGITFRELVSGFLAFVFTRSLSFRSFGRNCTQNTQNMKFVVVLDLAASQLARPLPLPLALVPV